MECGVSELRNLPDTTQLRLDLQASSSRTTRTYFKTQFEIPASVGKSERRRYLRHLSAYDLALNRPEGRIHARKSQARDILSSRERAIEFQNLLFPAGERTGKSLELFHPLSIMSSNSTGRNKVVTYTNLPTALIC